MNEWICAVQKLLDWIDGHVIENPSLSEISRQVGYSPWYCSEQFHRISGMTIKEYMAKRRLSIAALALRDTEIPLIDIALEYGFSSQQALTRAFTAAYGCAPSAYRRNSVPIPLTMKKTVITPSNYIKGDNIMSNLAVPSYRIEFIPARTVFSVYTNEPKQKTDLFPAHDCDLMTGIVQSIKDCHPIVTITLLVGNGLTAKEIISTA